MASLPARPILCEKIKRNVWKFHASMMTTCFGLGMLDDGITTQMPRIPWLEPELNGQRYGQMIHPCPIPGFWVNRDPTAASG